MVVQEQVPGGYSGSISRDEVVYEGIPVMRFTITNTYDKDTETETETETDTETVIESTTDTGEPDEFDDMYGRSDNSDLPRTGQLWWPIPVLAFGGLLRRRRTVNEEER